MSDELIRKSDARKVILKMAPELAYCINGIRPVDNAYIQKEATLVERVVDHEQRHYTVFECNACGANNERYHNFCGICGAKFKDIQYVGNTCEPSIQCP